METYKPIVSLLIAMRNEEEFIASCLTSIFDQDYPAEKMEIFVIDGKSTDASWKIVERLIRGKNNCYLLSNSKVIQSAAWNLGIQRAGGNLITIVSAHSILAPDYVSNAVETYLRTGADMVGGPMTAFGVTAVAKAISIATSNSFGVGGARFHYADKEEIVDTVYMGFCSRSLYLSVGGFDEEMVRNQDDELSYRILDHGGKIICDPNIRSKYYNRATLKSLWRQYYQYGYWKVRVLQKHPKQMRLRQFVPPIFISALIISAFMFFVPGVWILSLTVPILYMLINLCSSVWTGRDAEWRYIPLLLLVYAILHISYGLGFLRGLVKFANRWNDRVGQVPFFNNLTS